MKKDLNIGVLGAAGIARKHMIPAMSLVAGCRFWGVASRQLDKARAYAAEVGGGEAIEGYEHLIARPEVDVIYNALPNDLHVPYSLKALAAGKHVLCEKPVALNRQEAKALCDAANQASQLVAMEAFMYRFHPQWQQVLSWVEEGVIGDIRSISTQFCYYNDDPHNIRNSPEAGGGALMDVGCYGISAARMIMGVEPSRVIAVANRHPEYGVDNGMHMMLQFDNTACATVMVSTKTQRSQSVVVEGSKGRIIITHPFYCDEGDERLLRLETDASDQELFFGSDINHYALMLEAFILTIKQCGAIEENLVAQEKRGFQKSQAPVVPLGDSVANMAVIDAAFESAKRGIWVSIEH